MNVLGHQLLSFRKWLGFPEGTSGKEPACQCRRHRRHSVPGLEDLLEQGMATHSSVLAWRTPWTEEPGELQSIGLQSQTTERLRKHARYYVSPCAFAEIRKLGQRAKHGLRPVSVNKVLLEHSQAYLFTYCLWLLSCNNGRVE